MIRKSREPAFLCVQGLFICPRPLYSFSLSPLPWLSSAVSNLHEPLGSCRPIAALVWQCLRSDMRRSHTLVSDVITAWLSPFGFRGGEMTAARKSLVLQSVTLRKDHRMRAENDQDRGFDSSHLHVCNFNTLTDPLFPVRACMHILACLPAMFAECAECALVRVVCCFFFSFVSAYVTTRCTSASPTCRDFCVDRAGAVCFGAALSVGR